jgi:hypothetical protein
MDQYTQMHKLDDLRGFYGHGSHIAVVCLVVVHHHYAFLRGSFLLSLSCSLTPTTAKPKTQLSNIIRLVYSVVTASLLSINIYLYQPVGVGDRPAYSWYSLTVQWISIMRLPPPSPSSSRCSHG